MIPNKNIMQLAIDFAIENYKKEGHAIAAIIVKNNKIISKSSTTVNQNNDPTCHAEINAIKIAADKLKSKHLKNCYLYTTFEPCPMCTSAIIWAKMKGIIYGANMIDETKSHPQRIKIRCSQVIKKGSPKIKLYPNFMRNECKELLKLCQ